MGIHTGVLGVLLLLVPLSSSQAQADDGRWILKTHYASLGPRFSNDQWFVTGEGYHLHPRTENYTPGLSLGIERKISGSISVGCMFIYGRPTANLGIIDQYSSLEPLYKKGFNFLAALVSPNVALIRGDRSTFSLSPLFGWGSMSEVTITPSFGPDVTWSRRGEFVYGGKAGFTLRLKDQRFLFSTELIFLSMNVRLTEDQTGRELIRSFGPSGILLGFAYSLK